MNRFIFIIPLTPETRLTPVRRQLQKLCLDSLRRQKHDKWIALVIGDEMPPGTAGDQRFVHIRYESQKEEKLQHVTNYILDEKPQGEYIIRLDDDDVINPNVLKSLAHAKFNLYVDMFHNFWRPEANLFARRVRYWFPNTFIIDRSIAFTEFGEFPPGDHRNLRARPYLIENEHNSIHAFFTERQVPVVFAPSNSPVYLRSVSSSSITSADAGDTRSYFQSFGQWTADAPKDFAFLRDFSPGKPPAVRPGAALRERLANLKAEYAFRRLFKTGQLSYGKL